MFWILIAVFSYFLLAFESVANKFLISGKVKSWQLYLFYIGLLSAASFMFAPFGLHWPGIKIFAISVFAGMIFFGYLAFLFWSLKGTGATRVFVLIGSISTLVAVILSHMFLEERFEKHEFLGMFFLLVGGLVISFRFQEKRFFTDYKKVLAAGILLGFSMIILKVVYMQQNFISGYVYSRLGISGMVLVLLLFPSYRKAVFSLLKRKNKKQHAANFGAVVGVKTLAGVATALREYSISIGSVAIISALSSVQYFFVFVISTILALYFSKIFKENLGRKVLLTKAAGSFLVVLGVVLVMI